MQHYWGAPAILERIGLSQRSNRLLPRLILTLGIPAYLRRKPGHYHKAYYSNEILLTHWELSVCKDFREVLKSLVSNRIDRRFKALERKKISQTTYSEQVAV
jgi:hypothetical protein